MSSTKEIFDALTSNNSRDGCDGDWCRQILDDASSEDINRVKRALSRGSESEAARILGVMY